MNQNNFDELDSVKSPVKLLYKDDETGKNYLADCNNNINETDMFGRKLPFFLPKITGSMNGEQRAKLKLIKSKINSPSASNNNSFLNQNNNNNRISSSRKNINYYPNINRFDGFSYFPRPISNPFVNIPDFQMHRIVKRKIKEEMRKYYNAADKKIKDENNNNKIGLYFLTKDLNEYNIGEKDKEKLINLIDKNIEELKEDYQLKLNAITKNPKYISLNKYKNKLLLSKKNEIKFNEPPSEIKHKYQILKNINQNNAMRKKREFNLKEKRYIDKYFKDKNSFSIDAKKKNYKKITLSAIYKKNKKNKKNLVIGPDKLNDICRSKDFSVGRSIKMDFGNSSYEDKDKILINNTTSDKPIEENKINETMNDNNLPGISNTNISANKSKENFYVQDKDTAETVTHMNRNNTEAIIIDEKIGEDELSFISRETDHDKKNDKKTNVKKLKILKKNYEREKDLLEGINIETPREEVEKPLIKKKPVLKNNGQLYLENLAVLKLSNPKKYESLQKKEENDLQFLKKKLENSRKKLQNEFKK